MSELDYATAQRYKRITLKIKYRLRRNSQSSTTSGEASGEFSSDDG